MGIQCRDLDFWGLVFNLLATSVLLAGALQIGALETGVVLGFLHLMSAGFGGLRVFGQLGFRADAFPALIQPLMLRFHLLAMYPVNLLAGS